MDANWFMLTLLSSWQSEQSCIKGTMWEIIGDVYIPPVKARLIAVVCTSGSYFQNEPLNGQFLCSIVLLPHVNSNIFLRQLQIPQALFPDSWQHNELWFMLYVVLNWLLFFRLRFLDLLGLMVLPQILAGSIFAMLLAVWVLSSIQVFEFL